MRQRHILKPLLIALFWLAVWQGLAALVHNRIFLAGPAETLSALVRLLPTLSFWRTVGYSCARVLTGFVLAGLAGLGLAALGHRLPVVGELLSPILRLMRAVPVASFVILALLWAGSRRLTAVVVFLIVLPVIYAGARAGLSQADPAMLEVARVFRVGPGRRLWHIYRPALLPHLASALGVAVGLAWKSGVAAEVIGVCSDSIGERLYMSKLYLETDQLFAWTAVIVALRWLSEKLLARLLERWTPGGRKGGAA